MNVLLDADKRLLGLRAVTRWFPQRDILTQFSLARIMDDVKPRRRGRRPGTYVDEDDGDC
jgi:hypothetical protein